MNEFLVDTIDMKTKVNEKKLTKEVNKVKYKASFQNC